MFATADQSHNIILIDAYDDGTFKHLECSCGWKTQSPVPAAFVNAIQIRHRQLSSITP